MSDKTDELVARARAVRIEEVIASRGIELKGQGHERIGACPQCRDGKDRFAINTQKQVFNCRVCGGKGGVVDLVMWLDGCDFKQAVATLAGEEWPRSTKKPPEDEAKRNAARNRAFRRWNDAKPAREHPYLRSKNVPSFGLRVDDAGVLLMPMRNDGDIHTLQLIEADGTKLYLKDGRKQGCWFEIAKAKNDDGTVICIAEGYATAASIRQATGHLLAVAGDASNLLPVAKQLRSKYPNDRIVVCADDDWKVSGNPGMAKAMAAADAVDGLIARPAFGKGRKPNDTDFNDMARTSGSAAVKQAIEHAVKPAAIDSAKLAASCKYIIDCDDVLELLAQTLTPILAGDMRNAKLTYLICTSRLFADTMHGVYKGPSSGGKSYERDIVLRTMPPEDVKAMTGFSEKALYYIGDMRHKILSMGEATDPKDTKVQDQILRQLMSEGKLVYKVAPARGEGDEAIEIVVEGPIVSLVTTTRTQLHPENETRTISMEINDTPQQTRAIMLKVAELEGTNKRPATMDFAPWHDFQRLIALGERRVEVPYWQVLAQLTSNSSIRMRRDIGQLLRAIKAHALIHRAHRDLSADGAIVASFRDYWAVRALLGDILSEASELKVRATILKTVEAVKTIAKQSDDNAGVTVRQVAAALKLDMSAARRRLYAAEDRGLIENTETRAGRTGKYRCTSKDGLQSTQVLPTTKQLQEAFEASQDIKP
jgi:phage/plasmid primase-like uncharacterized protein